MVDTTELKESVQREVEALSRARNDLFAQLKLAKSEAKVEWSRLETTFEKLQLEIRRIGIDAREPLKDIGSAARNLIGELKNGVARAKREVKSGFDA
ncbi:MAG: hypothetical protein ABW252_13975 [Polyangiales bacterium]